MIPLVFRLHGAVTDGKIIAVEAFVVVIAWGSFVRHKWIAFILIYVVFPLGVLPSASQSGIVVRNDVNYR